MMNYFMGDVSLKVPLTYEMQSAMGGIITEVAQYYNEDGAIGYTFKYFLEGLKSGGKCKDNYLLMESIQMLKILKSVLSNINISFIV